MLIWLSDIFPAYAVNMDFSSIETNLFLMYVLRSIYLVYG